MRSTRTSPYAFNGDICLQRPRLLHAHPDDPSRNEFLPTSRNIESISVSEQRPFLGKCISTLAVHSLPVADRSNASPVIRPENSPTRRSEPTIEFL